ncbi:MAG TPA: nitroreductase family protein [Dehalococcoidia bacterium]|nr:nitroreductase family protein [Dehalococcoidia bacterium]
MDAIEAIRTRRSIRAFLPRPVPEGLIEELVALACAAPAPHHTQPWRFVTLGAEARETLAEAMGAAWRSDLERDGLPAERIEALLARSRTQILGAPALVLGGLVDEGLRRWPDERRRQAEWGLAMHSFGAALQNLMLAAHAKGLASFWISAPLFCPDAVRRALRLPEAFVAQALVALGYPDPSYRPRNRPPVQIERVLERR